MNSIEVPLSETYGPLESYVDADEVLAFARALNDDNAEYRAGTATPPTYPVVPGYPVMMGMRDLPEQALTGFRGKVHGSHDIRLFGVPTPDTKLITDGERVGVSTNRAGMNVVHCVRTFDESETLLAEQLWSVLHLGQAKGPSRGRQPADHTFPPDARARPVGRTTVPTDADQTFRYAGASADRAPIHVSDRAARELGYPRKFMQGLGTLGMSTRGLTDMIGVSPRHVARIAVRFAGAMFPGDDLDLTVFDIGSIDDSTYAYAFEARSDDRLILRDGRIEVRRE
jgi:acyl dehydratase